MSGGKVVHVNSGMDYDLYIGRKMPRYGLKKSLLANSLKIGEDGTRSEILSLYEWYVRDHLAESPDGPMAEMVTGLSGLTLACWCAPKDRALTLDDPEICHGQVLLRLAKELS